MPDYQEGKIYKITSEQLPGKCYIGSTAQTLKNRLYGHRGDYKRYLKGTRPNMTSSIIICYSDAKITLLEDFPCESKKELEKREGVIMKCYMEDNELDDVVNKYLVGRSGKEWEIDNKERVAATKKVWREANKEHISEHARLMYLENRDERKRKVSERYHKNRDKINEIIRVKRLENKEWRDEVNRKHRESYHKNKEVNRAERNRKDRERYHAKHPQSKKYQSKISPV